MKPLLILLLIGSCWSIGLAQDSSFVPYARYDTLSGNYVICYDSSEGVLFSTILVPQSKINPLTKANVSHLETIYTYSYLFINGPQSQQSIYSFDLESNMVDTAFIVPDHWIFGAYEYEPYVQFLHDFQGVDIAPGDSLNIVLNSANPPTIVTARFSGRPEITDLEFEREPDERVKSLIDSLKGIVATGQKSFATIGPIDPTLLLEFSSFFDSLRSYTLKSRSENWINDDSVMNKYIGLFEASKSSFDHSDLASSKLFLQSSLDNISIDSGTVISGEGYALLRYNAEYLLDHLPAGSEVSSYSLIATHSLWLEQNSDVFSGDIGVNEVGTAPFLDSQVELSIGIGTTTSSGYSIKANRIKVKQGATVGSGVYYNELDNNGTITGTLHTPLSLPLVSSLPEFKVSTPGTQNITIPQNGTQTLQPGSYGDIDVKKNGKLIITGGEYHLNSFTGGDNIQLVFQSPAVIRIAGKFDSGQGSSIGPEDTTTVTAKDVVIYVGGINGSNGNLGATPKSAKIGISNTVRANFYVPNGTLWIRQNSEVTGAFVGKDVDVGIGVKVWLKSAF